MDSADMTEQSNSSIITKYDDALISLANARCGYKNSIVKYLNKISQAELSYLKKMNYKEIDPSFPEAISRKFSPQSNQLSNTYRNAAILEDGVIEQSKNLKSEIVGLKNISLKLSQEKENIPQMS